MDDDNFPRAAWLSLNDEFTPIPAFKLGREPKRADFDPEWVEAADRFAEEKGLPKFDVLGDVDRAAELLKEKDL